MLRAGAALAAWVDLAALADVAPNAAHVLVVDALHLLDAERADAPTRATTTGAAAIATVTAIAAVPVATTV